MRKQRITSILALALGAAGVLAGCGDETPKQGQSAPEHVTGAKFAFSSGADVDKMQFVIKRVTCDGEIIAPLTKTETIDIAGQGPGGGVLTDYFTLLDPGCYDVTAQPLTASGEESASCSAGYIDKLVIVDGFTTEAGLLITCEGKPVGAADIWVALNTPPFISKVTFNPNKFVSHCDTQTICVEFTEPDGDPVDIEWYQRSGATLAAGPTPGPIQYDPATGISTQCATLDHAGPGTVGLEVIAYDKMIPPGGGGLIRVEDYFAGMGLTVQSRDSLQFPSHGTIGGDCACTPLTEICDIFDNDCDGQNNEGLNCACMPFETASCYSGPLGTAGVGVCRSGGKPCKLDGSGFESTCLGEVLPSTEQCNGKDDDCDGQVDEGVAGCVAICSVPSSQDCVYTGPVGTQNVGECQAGQQICLVSKWSSCTGEVLPVAEIVGNLKDDDCDGMVDEAACMPSPEVCDGVDNDCNGQVDEGTTSCGVGACQVTVNTCSAGMPQTCIPKAPAAGETCNNGIDDDCDGQTDEGCVCVPNSTQACAYSGPAATQNVGVCKAGSQTCQANGTWTVCSGEVVPTPEIPGNGLDENCNSKTDEGLEVCNGVDDDQNGQIDDGFGPVSCGVGACANTVQSCVNGQPQTCMPIAPAANEICANGIDDDCDGQTDEALCVTPPNSNAICLSECAGNPDGICSADESSFTCNQDCACGDGLCSGTETAANCPADCKLSNDASGFCGNGYCESFEVNRVQGTILCQQDCWNMSTPAGTKCGDGICSGAETSIQCAADCGNVTSYVNGDGTCQAGESRFNSFDCSQNLEKGIVLGSECSGYALIETHADGNGGVETHTVTNCSESCGAAPWKEVSAYQSNGYWDWSGAQLLRPDCTICTITGAPMPNIVADAYHNNLWASLGSTYEMDQNPNNCDTGVRDIVAGSWHVSPLEWEKTGEKQCANDCNVYDCYGNVTPQSNGKVGLWKPRRAPWSVLEPYCQ